jgi:hypothetical protein
VLFLLDTDVLIAAKNLYYPLDRIPQFWRWILHHAACDHIKIPTKVIEEVVRGSTEDELSKWVRSNRVTLELDEEVDARDWSETLTAGYGYTSAETAQQDLVDQRADPFLIAHALSDTSGRRIVTLEKVTTAPINLPNPVNRKIPTVCDLLNIAHLDTFALIRELDFRIPL